MIHETAEHRRTAAMILRCFERQQGTEGADIENTGTRGTEVLDSTTPPLPLGTE